MFARIGRKWKTLSHEAANWARDLFRDALSQKARDHFRQLA
jgi:hypothetical protein